MNVVTRFAPSPTGLLHLGHAYAAAMACRTARRAAGTYLVRIEDIDPQRCRPAFTAAILEDLAWLGLASELPVRVQSAHLTDYAATLAVLRSRGLLYPCFCSRAEIAREWQAAGAAPHGPDTTPPYPGTCRDLPASRRDARLARGDPHAWRLDMRAATAQAPALQFHEAETGWTKAAPAGFGDVVLGRRDIHASYHLCVTHDDAIQGVTHVTRARDLLGATHLHVLLQHLMGWPTPAYAHHAVRLAADGTRLSKRTNAPTLRDLRLRGATPAQVLALLDEATAPAAGAAHTKP